MNDSPQYKKLAFEVSSPAARARDQNYSGTTSAIVGQIVSLDISVVTSSIAALVDEMAQSFRPREGGPKQCEVEFGLKLTAEGGLIVSKLGGEVSLRVKVTWDRG